MSQETEAVARERAERFLREGGNYTDPYEREKLVRDWEKKGDVAEQVVGDLTRRAGDPSGKRLLDIGFGSGMYSIAFAKSGADTYGLEVNPVLHEIAKEGLKEAHVYADFRLYDGSTFPFADNFFDYIFSVS